MIDTNRPAPDPDASYRYRVPSNNVNAHTDDDSRTNVADTHGPATYPATPPDPFGAGENTTGAPPGCHTVTSPDDGASTAARDDQLHDHPGPKEPADPDNNEL